MKIVKINNLRKYALIALRIVMSGLVVSGVATNGSSVYAFGKVTTKPSDKAMHEKTSHEAHWGYKNAGTSEGSVAPKNWGNIKEEFATCSSGKAQSPIDIQATLLAVLPNLQIDYQATPLKILNNGHTVQVNYPQGSVMKVADKTYDLLQFHFHTLSENTIDGKHYDMELHFVHQREDGALGVLAVMIKEGEQNDAAQKIWDHLPMVKTSEKNYSKVFINGKDLLPDNRQYYRFMGSLTTPPCSEGVNWHVLKQPIEFSSKQIAKFKRVFVNNARPVQSKNSRLIVLDKE